MFGFLQLATFEETQIGYYCPQSRAQAITNVLQLNEMAPWIATVDEFYPLEIKDGVANHKLRRHIDVLNFLTVSCGSTSEESPILGCQFSFDDQKLDYQPFQEINEFQTACNNNTKYNPIVKKVGDKYLHIIPLHTFFEGCRLPITAISYVEIKVEIKFKTNVENPILITEIIVGNGDLRKGLSAEKFLLQGTNYKLLEMERNNLKFESELSGSCKYLMFRFEDSTGILMNPEFTCQFLSEDKVYFEQSDTYFSDYMPMRHTPHGIDSKYYLYSYVDNIGDKQLTGGGINFDKTGFKIRIILKEGGILPCKVKLLSCNYKCYRVAGGEIKDVENHSNGIEPHDHITKNSHYEHAIKELKELKSELKMKI